MERPISRWRPDDLSRLRHRRVVLADVHAVGSGGGDQVRPVVEDEEGVVGGARPGKPARGIQQELVIGGVLHAELHDVDAAAQRALQEGIRARVADQVQASLREALAAVVHAASLAGAPR